jgi:hypothetical protein
MEVSAQPVKAKILSKGEKFHSVKKNIRNYIFTICEQKLYGKIASSQ